MFVVETMDEIYGEDFIAHHGTKGMRWGMRRYQNPDGSLTPAGRKRYMKNNRFRQKYHREQAKRLEEERRRSETLQQRKARLMKSSDAEEIFKNKDLFTNEEIRNRIDRIKIENELASYIKHKPTRMDKAKKAMDNAITIADKAGKFLDTKAGKMIVKEVKKQMGIDTTPTFSSYESILNNLNKVDSAKLKDYKERAKNEKELRKYLDELRKMNEAEAQRIKAQQEAQQKAQAQQQAQQVAQQQARRRKRKAYWNQIIV